MSSSSSSMSFSTSSMCNVRRSLLLGLVIVVCCFPCASEQRRSCVNRTVKCEEGVVLPVWEPRFHLSTGDRLARATVYFILLMYMFLGVSIIADRFMAAIEVITSQEREVTIKLRNGEKQLVSVRIWNETVSNLTLMALGSSAPEILLSIIEICGKHFEAGDLGPGTIVGSAAFNLFVIIGLCVIVIPNGESRSIKHLSVFFITATWSIFAYLWLYLIIAAFSPGVIQVWEGLLTFAFFPLTVFTAYEADTKIFLRKFLPAKFTGVKVKSVSKPGDAGATDAELELGKRVSCAADAQAAAAGGGAAGTGAAEAGNGGRELAGGEQATMDEYEKHRTEYIAVLRDIYKRHPNIDPKQMEEMAQLEVLNRGPKSRAFYRMQATRNLTGGGNVIKKSKVERRQSCEQDTNKAVEEDPHLQLLYFDPGHYTVFENVGTFQVTVKRRGGNVNAGVSVSYITEDGTATAGEDFIAATGVITFQPGETQAEIPVTIIDDDIFEEDEHFYIRLFDQHWVEDKMTGLVQLGNPSMATIVVLDDDHSGIFQFEFQQTNVPESSGQARFKVLRSSGARGVVRVPYQTMDGSAKGLGKDYENADGFIEFQNDETEGFISIQIVDSNQYEKNEFFYIQLGEPQLQKKNDSGDLEENDEKADAGKPRLGEWSKIEVHIVESTEFKNTVDHLLKAGKWSLVVGTSSWKEQFIEAITINAGDDDDGQGDDDDSDPPLPSCMDYLMHFLTIFWKVLFAFVPPTDYMGGWLSFTVSIIMIGLLTAVIGDLASGFGCTIGLSDSVTAISFVALGTSLPDTFASKVAAIGDAYADSSIGNVTGSNAVNVFLGIGIAWSIAAIYHAVRGTQFKVEAGSLGFSVTVFCIFALFAILLLFCRRHRGGELGGPVMAKYISGCALFALWVLYIVLAALENYCHIPGF